MIEGGRAPAVPQWEGGASYDQLWQKKELAQVRPTMSPLRGEVGGDLFPIPLSDQLGAVCSESAQLYSRQRQDPRGLD